jgi:hypothetical protein
VKALIATYAGDANFNGSVSFPATAHTVNLASLVNTTTTITSDLPDPSAVGEVVTIHYSVAAVDPESGTPTGNVTVSDGTQSCTGTVEAGSCTIAFATPGLKALTATYAGDVNFNGSISSPATTHMVNRFNIIYLGLICLAIYLILGIVGIILVIILGKKRRKGKNHPPSHPQEEPPCHPVDDPPCHPEDDCHPENDHHPKDDHHPVDDLHPVDDPPWFSDQDPPIHPGVGWSEEHK